MLDRDWVSNGWIFTLVVWNQRRRMTISGLSFVRLLFLSDESRVLNSSSNTKSFWLILFIPYKPVIRWMFDSMYWCVETCFISSRIVFSLLNWLSQTCQLVALNAKLVLLHWNWCISGSLNIVVLISRISIQSQIHFGVLKRVEKLQKLPGWSCQ